MNTTRMPGFSADASFYRSRAPYQGGAMLAGLRQGGKGIVHPAVQARPYISCRSFKSMKGPYVICEGPGFTIECISGDCFCGGPNCP